MVVLMAVRSRSACYPNPHIYLKVSREHSTGSQAVEFALVLIILINYLPPVAAECIV